MRITIRHPAGLEIDFEGEQQEFERFVSFLGDPPAFVGSSVASSMALAVTPEGGAEKPAITAGGFDVTALAAQIERSGANSDIERVTVIAQFVVDSGREGLDYTTANRLYDELGQRKPQRIRSTFANAKARGFLRNVGRGLWRPTVAGENFARYGRKEV